MLKVLVSLCAILLSNALHTLDAQELQLAVPALEASETFPSDGLYDQQPAHWRIVWTEDPQHRAVILWDTAKAGGDHRVHFDAHSRAEVPDPYKHCTKAQRSGRYTGDAPELHWHATELEQLEPDTIYYFVLESDGQRSPEMHFRTAPEKSQSFSYLSGGDARSNREQRRAINRQIGELIDLRPEIIAFAHGGDFVLWGTQLKLWDRWLRDQELMIGKSGRLLPFVATRGNHEATGPLFDEVFGAPGGAMKNYYATQLSPDHLLVTLNTEISAGGDQAQFLEQTLERHRSVPWQLVQYHRPIWPAVKLPCTAAPHWSPLFDRYLIDLALESDGHALKRTVPILNGAHDENGVLYIGEGGLGVAQRTPDSARWYLQAPGYAHPLHHIWELRCAPDVIQVVAWDLQSGKIFEEFPLRKRQRPVR